MQESPLISGINCNIRSVSSDVSSDDSFFKRAVRDIGQYLSSLLVEIAVQLKLLCDKAALHGAARYRDIVTSKYDIA